MGNIRKEDRNSKYMEVDISDIIELNSVNKQIRRVEELTDEVILKLTCDYIYTNKSFYLSVKAFDKDKISGIPVVHLCIDIKDTPDIFYKVIASLNILKDKEEVTLLRVDEYKRLRDRGNEIVVLRSTRCPNISFNQLLKGEEQ